MPASNWPVIVPGSVTIPATAMTLIVGIMPVDTALRRGKRAASHRLAPKAKRVSTWFLWVVNSSPRRSSARDTPLTELPKIIPINGIAYWGVYHGRIRMMTNKVITMITQELKKIDATLLSQTPGYRRFDRWTAATPATSDIVSMTRSTSVHWSDENTHRRINPT